MDTSFYLIKPRIAKTDIFDKVYITDLYVYFIKVGGQFHNRFAYEKQLPEILELIFLYWFKKMEKKQTKIENDYDQMIKNNEVSQLLNKRPNFSLENSEISEIILSKKRTFHTGFNDNGTIIFSLMNGKTIMFIIPRNTLRMEIKKCMNIENQAFTLREE
ncbi:hypothetical protein [Peribacillus alkalitolerans]|uniref:hypothetical protein n=1 Tax=Peribacillus alkalitolerans TaxID=1550385 RepID=UPI0013CF8B35|nr:hypothetical protein [Peribacillus alkalitolerans]